MLVSITYSVTYSNITLKFLLIVLPNKSHQDFAFIFTYF